MSFMPKLSERMRAVADMVTRGNSCADIGCDHGYVAIYLYLAGACPFCICTDVNAGPLQRAQTNIVQYGAGKGVSTRLSWGLEKIEPGEVGTILISGMGGVMIKKILTEGLEVTRKSAELVLEPQSEPESVRRFLLENGFAITEEAMVKEEGKFYPVIKAERTGEAFVRSEEELYFGPCLLNRKDTVLLEMLRKRKKTAEAIREQLRPVAGSEAVKNRLGELELDLQRLERALERYDK